VGEQSLNPRRQFKSWYSDSALIDSCINQGFSLEIPGFVRDRRQVQNLPQFDRGFVESRISRAVQRSMSSNPVTWCLAMRRTQEPGEHSLSP
jgi:hypothetical protein